MDEDGSLTPVVDSTRTSLAGLARPLAKELAPAASAIPPLTILEASSPRLRRLGAELWAHRELLLFLAWRDVKVRYQQTVLGVLWAILQPTVTMLVFVLFLGRVAHMVASTTVPYALFLLTGLVPWMFFANALTSSSQSIVGSQQLITKVYFPRLAIPLSAVLASSVDFLIMMLLLLGFLVGFGVPMTGMTLLAPFFMLGILAAAAGAGTWLSALTVAYRDFRFLLPFIVQIGMFLTPVVYGWEPLPTPWRWLILANPMTGWVESFRACLLGQWGWTTTALMSIALMITALLNLSAWHYFQRVERRFADVI